MIARALLLALLASDPASVRRADAAWASGDYAAAAGAYAEAYAETGDVAYLYARGQALQESGAYADAIAVYEAFIATEPKQQWGDAARAAIEECREQLPPQPGPESEAGVIAAADLPAGLPAEARAAPPADPGPPLDDAPDATRPWHRDPAGALLLAFGGAGLATGTALALVARSNQAAADRASDVVEYGVLNDRAVALSRASVPVLAIGGALVVGGVIRYALVARRRPARSPRVSLGPQLRIRF